MGSLSTFLPGSILLRNLALSWKLVFRDENLKWLVLSYSFCILCCKAGIARLKTSQGLFYTGSYVELIYLCKCHKIHSSKFGQIKKNFDGNIMYPTWLLFRSLLWTCRIKSCLLFPSSHRDTGSFGEISMGGVLIFPCYETAPLRHVVEELVALLPYASMLLHETEEKCWYAT